MQSDKNMSEAI